VQEAKKKKIVVIEDDPDVTEVLRGLFDSSGYEGYFFKSGKEAIEMIDDILPDLGIMDLMMPEMSGFEVCQHLKRSGKTRNIPLIAITGYDSRENRLKIFAAGIDDYLPKPFDVRTLLKKIKSLIS
jgi:CheY-like chemotaxis protein